MLITNITSPPTAKQIGLIIKSAAERHRVLYDLYDRYMAGPEGTPIKTREYYIGSTKQTDKINNKINNDFFGEIIDVKVGFFTGIPIVYDLERTTYETKKTVLNTVMDKARRAIGMAPKPEKEETIVSPQYDKDLAFIRDFNKLNSVADLDAETAKRASICGFCGRLLYVEEVTGYLRAIAVNPWECIFVGPSVDVPLYSIRYYTVIGLDDDGKESKVYKAYLYDAFNVTEFERNDDEEEYKQGKVVRHMLPGNPLIGFANNDELQGDAEKELELIDAYDRALSDVNNEVEQFRLAYMVFSGAQITGEVMKQAQQTGGFSLTDPNGSVDFITKKIDDAIIEHHLDRIEANIYRFSKTPNMKDIQFGSNLTGVAMAFKFRPFEYKCIASELKFKKSLRQQFKLLSEIWNAKGAKINYLDVDFVFTRNYPQNLLEEAEIQTKLKGVVSDKTRLALASFIDDPEQELEDLNNDKESMMIPPLEQDDKDNGNGTGAQPVPE
ncbi:MAG TPA: phage portal protein [Dissulfurispiraceae bacterium]|jgi:SPP1 family phage portal protein|nr:phage portal protein [Dissulfurispiraceae bacterium]